VSWRRYPAYRDSGVEWLGEIPEHWEKKRLKYISSVNDETLNEATYPGYEIQYVDISSVDAIDGIKKKETMIFENAPSRARRKVKGGDVIVSTVRTYLRAIAPINKPEENLVVSTGFAVIRPKREFESQFASYALRAPYFVDTVVANSVGVSYPAINASELVTFYIGLPPLPEQRAIAAFLDRETARIDRLAALKRKQIELLQEKRAALISHAVTRGLDPTVPMKDSGVEWLGEIPEHWDVQPLRGLLVQRGEYNDGPKTTNILSVVKDIGVINYDERESSGNKKSDNIEQYKIIKKGDIVLNRMNVIIGSVGVAKEDGAASIEYYVLHEKDNSVHNAYYGCIFATKLFQSNLGRLGSGILGHRLRIPFEVLKKEQLPKPPLHEQRAIESYVNYETDYINVLSIKVNDSITLLKEYRTALISAAVTGKIDVREV